MLQISFTALCVKTPYDDSLGKVDGFSDGEDDQDGLNVTIYPDIEDSSQHASVHNYLYRKPS
jgi:hypothetical protein